MSESHSSFRNSLLMFIRSLDIIASAEEDELDFLHLCRNERPGVATMVDELQIEPDIDTLPATVSKRQAQGGP